MGCSVLQTYLAIKDTRSHSVIHKASLWNRLGLSMLKNIYKSTEFIPSSTNYANEAAKPVPTKQSISQPPAGGKSTAGKLAWENTGKGYSLYGPKEPCKKLSKVIKVNPCQPREIDGQFILPSFSHCSTDSTALIIGQWPMAAPKLIVIYCVVPVNSTPPEPTLDLLHISTYTQVCFSTYHQVHFSAYL
ncbi:hypothetical protein PAXRUDRAFT_167011 [Paxillus rubicundulus Ve08.2h10]|uniref:Uncharacterized protein n=1 Tax=Paxillus rubicundulus Ve08.2h10 TaxID=930991 RepID=A0A0D0DHB3_9AGAM|nr:hypothetical protein PAXRUDRAFT_167011 [Paxillus rubicundulus Ve08.2h10]